MQRWWLHHLPGQAISVPSTAGQSTEGFGDSQGDSGCKAMGSTRQWPWGPLGAGQCPWQRGQSPQDSSPHARVALQGQGWLLWDEALQNISAVKSLQPSQTCTSCPASGSLGALGDLLGRVFGPFSPPCRFFTQGNVAQVLWARSSSFLHSQGMKSP